MKQLLSLYLYKYLILGIKKNISLQLIFVPLSLLSHICIDTFFPESVTITFPSFLSTFHKIS